jgi:ribosomal protein L7/L12
MNAILLFAALMLGWAAFGVMEIRRSRRHLAALRARGQYPQEGKEREADVLSLLKAGEKVMAIRCYRALHRAGLRDAKKAVELIEKNNA